MKKTKHLFISLLLVTFITSCATQYEQPRIQSATKSIPSLSPGFYVLETDWWYDEVFCEILNLGNYYQVNILSTRGTSFGLKPKHGGKYVMVESDIGFDRVNRKIKGDGVSTGKNLIEGWATVIVKGLGPIARDRRTGLYSLRPATQSEVDKAVKKKWVK